MLSRWTIDPLRGLEGHIAFNKLGAIAVGYERNIYGQLRDSTNEGLASDRLIVEWWLTSPRVNAVVDNQVPPYHFHLGLDKMEVATRTTLTDDGYRRLIKFNDSVCNGITKSAAALIEIPANLDSMRLTNIDLARDWRLKTRDIFEQMFNASYIITGLVHEGGRSFQLFERESKPTILERSS
jgi:predicted GNAT superfamily acetyltransferase